MYYAEEELFSEPLIEYLTNLKWTLMESPPDIAVLRKIYDGEEEEIVLPITTKESWKPFSFCLSLNTAQ